MSDLPIKVSTVSAKPAASKSAGNTAAAQQDAQDFGNVLARQVADAAKPAESATRSSGENIQQTAEQDSAKTSRVEVTDSALPADIMAALLAQQTPFSAPQPEAQAQTFTQAPADADLPPLLDGQATIGKQAGVTLPLPSGKTNPADAAMAEAIIALPQINDTNLKSKGLSDTFKAAVMKETSTSSSTPSLRGANVINDMANAMQQQPAAIPLLTTGAAASISQQNIHTDLSQPTWGDEFSQKISWMVTQRNQTAELHLNPPQLGPLDVTLKMNGDQASAIFTSTHAAVREAIEQALPRLREMLADSGIMLGNAMVSDHAAKNSQDNPAHNPAGRSQNSVSASSTEEANIQEIRVSPLSRHNGMVDTFA